MRVVVAVLGLLVLGSGGWMACRHLAPAEQKILRRLESMAAGFNDTRLAPCMDGLAEDYHDANGADREWLRQGLVTAFFREVDPATRKFRWRVEIPAEQARIAVDPEGGDTARAELVARFHERAGSEEDLRWEVRIQADLAETREGWRIVRTRHETIAGSKLWR